MENDLQNLGAKIASSQNILILVRQNPSLDSMAASLSLYLSLKNIGKQVSIVCQSEAIVRDSHLVGIDELKTTLGGQNLVTS